MAPRFLIDFNEWVEPDLVLLSKTDVRLDANGLPIRLVAGMLIEVFEHDTEPDGTPNILIARGVAEPNVNGPDWAQAATWCCRIDAAGIRHEP